MCTLLHDSYFAVLYLHIAISFDQYPSPQAEEVPGVTGPVLNSLADNEKIVVPNTPGELAEQPAVGSESTPPEPMECTSVPSASPAPVSASADKVSAVAGCGARAPRTFIHRRQMGGGNTTQSIHSYSPHTHNISSRTSG